MQGIISVSHHHLIPHTGKKSSDINDSFVSFFFRFQIFPSRKFSIITFLHDFPFRKVTEDDIDMSFQGRDIEVASVESSFSC